MKISTSSLLVNRLLTTAFTFALLISVSNTSASTKYTTPDNASVEYASLTATATDNSVFINWVTVSEHNNSHFEVERSTNMEDFKTIALVLDGFTTTGNTTSKTYKFKEAAGDIKKGKTVYYRLKQVDNDNQIHYSKVMAVQMNASVKVYPHSQILLSNKVTTSMCIAKTPAVSSIELTTGLLNHTKFIFGAELFTSELTFA